MNIYEAIADIMAQGYAIGKNNKNQQQGFKYRGIDDVMNTFQPLMAARGVFTVPEILEHYREERQTAKGGNLIYSILKVKYTFYAADGTSVSAVVIGEGMDSADKSSNKAMAAAMKYAMFQTFCIPTEEMQMDDPDRVTPVDSRRQAQPQPAATTPAQQKPPTSAPQQPEQPIRVDIDHVGTCACCGVGITDVIGRNGVRTAAEIKLYSMAHFGKPMCGDCLKKAKAAAKQEQQT